MPALALMLVLATLLFHACREPEAVQLFPTISFSSSEVFIDRSMSLPPGARITVGFIASRADAKLSRVSIFQDGQPYTPYRDQGSFEIKDSASKNTFRDSLSFTLPQQVGATMTLTFRVEDAKGQRGEASLRFITSVPQVFDTTVVLYAQGPYTGADSAAAQAAGRVIGSVYSIVRNQVLDSVQLLNSLLVPQADLNYGVDTNGHNLITSPGIRSNITGQSLLSGAPITLVDTSSADIATADGTALFNLAVPDTTAVRVVQAGTYKFRTAGRRNGLIYVQELNNAPTARQGYIRFRLKVLK